MTTKKQYNRRQEWNRRMKAEGRCLSCAKKTPKNKLTGKPMLRCRPCQNKANKANAPFKKAYRNKLWKQKLLAERKRRAKNKHDAEVKRQKRVLAAVAGESGKAGIGRD